MASGHDKFQTDIAPATGSIEDKTLREKYKTEREKRLRVGGNAQYRSTEGELANYLEDPFIDRELERNPITRDVDVLVIGGGFGGLMAAARLHESGVTNFMIIEKGSDFGGTWYWNRYPGAACDIESYIYLPLLDELGYVPVEKYSRGPEIFEHSRAIGRKYDLYRRARFGTEVKELRWDDDSALWVVSTNRGDTICARFVCMSTGPLQRPKLPNIPGITSFEGHSFHTSRWDYTYTGGDASGGLKGLTDKRVGIIGTGATAVQCIPHLGKWAKHLYVFQRTPVSVAPRGNCPTDLEWAKSLKPGWQKQRMDNFNAIVCGEKQSEDLVADGWTSIFSTIGVELAGHGELAEQRQLADFQYMEEVRARIDAVVKDLGTAAALKPYYNVMCKRPAFHDTYLETFNRPNVTLVDTQGNGVERVTKDGIIANGTEYKIDCLIYSTGFEFQTDFEHRNGFKIYGRNGKSLGEKWKDGLSTLWGYHTRDFPNCFIMGNGQGANTPNFTHMLNVGSQHIAYIVKHCIDNRLRAIEPTEQAEQAWVEHVMSFAGIRQKYDLECTPSYYNNEGMPSDITSTRNNFYMGGAFTFIKLLEDWRLKGNFDLFDREKDDKSLQRSAEKRQLRG
ncbi:flavin-containing monooxygenase [Noviherbaspirillum saxi]|uniref:NAD(P)/FAD-dependent oxidoreductase n=1 Tax=Noviherbaspirillum saxi TaxID=2320863 RepID=A0A3A3FIJ5_9BURK|nr:NAD(P)/FAD-dependent oxidoreductase [Noviherbaspirillum saxi]RJF92354.1 NAD(P)/FAD-dependent oxidoreductase [Noviherbaspirillum saxi]